MTSETTVNAKPTKRFFISMITRDIELKPAIIDLLDNSIDGARSLIAEGVDPKGFLISINLDKEELRIRDNCGGIDLDIARTYAFRFGRPDEAKAIPHSVGQFGIGMKRALFKFGQAFSVESASRTDSFSLSVSVPEWEKSETWEFELDDYTEAEDRAVEDTYTTIIANKLFPSVSKTFDDKVFRNQLEAEVAMRHQFSLTEGVAIELNGKKLLPRVLALASSSELQPFHSDEEIAVFGGTVRVRITAGVAESLPDDAGWYVFCNDRLIVGADQTSLTAWGVRSPARVPKYHNQYARFRGFVRFDADDAGLLPWNTTKTSLDQDSNLWIQTRSRMIKATSSAISFLNDLKEEIETLNKLRGAEADDFEGPEVGHLRGVIEDAGQVPFSATTAAQSFEAPEGVIETPDDTVSIQFRRPVSEVDVLKGYFGTESARKAGEAAFALALEFAEDDE